jgi:copper transport protein
MRRLATVVLVAVATAFPDAAAAAERAFHTQLEASVPAAGDTVAVAPEALVLTFGGLVEESGAVIRLLGPSGRSLLLEVTRVAGSVRELTAPLPSLEPGGYRLEWRVISGDGHPISGDFVFWVRGETGAGAGAEPTPPPPPSPEGLHGHEGHGPTGGLPSLGLAATRAGADIALLLITGLLLFGAFGGPAPSRRTAATTKALAAGAPLLVTAHAWIWTDAVSEVAAGAGDRWNALVDLFTGRALAAELGLAVLVPWALLLARRASLAAVFAALAVAAGAFSGHPASHSPALAIPANALHQLAAAAWMGGLLFLVTEAGTASFAISARRVSGVALVAAAAVAATGLLQAWLLVDSLAQLVETPYGLLLLGKGAGLLGLVAFGAYHRFRWFPGIAAGGPAARVSGSVGAELAFAAGVVALAAFMSHVPPNP